MIIKLFDDKRRLLGSADLTGVSWETTDEYEFVNKSKVSVQLDCTGRVDTFTIEHNGIEIIPPGEGIMVCRGTLNLIQGDTLLFYPGGFKFSVNRKVRHEKDGSKSQSSVGR